MGEVPTEACCVAAVKLRWSFCPAWQEKTSFSAYCDSFSTIEGLLGKRQVHKCQQAQDAFAELLCLFLPFLQSRRPSRIAALLLTRVILIRTNLFSIASYILFGLKGVFPSSSHFPFFRTPYSAATVRCVNRCFHRIFFTTQKRLDDWQVANVFAIGLSSSTSCTK